MHHLSGVKERRNVGSEDRRKLLEKHIKTTFVLPILGHLAKKVDKYLKKAR